ncbi:MAG TPA: hypothetical protein PK176_05405 [Acidobacteriota bacterium]|nr:hypothetical protein [Acidobacteriota bacterium]HQM62728.1 hypothetical protein [Acidobacteriota bacterium]
MVKISGDGFPSPANQPLDPAQEPTAQRARPSEFAASAPPLDLAGFGDAFAPAGTDSPGIIQDILSAAKSSAPSPLAAAHAGAGLPPDFAAALSAFQTALPAALRSTGPETAFWQDRTVELRQLVALTGAGGRQAALPDAVGGLLDSFFDHLGRLPESGLGRELLGRTHGLLRGAFESVREHLHGAAGQAAADSAHSAPGGLSDAIRNAENQMEQVRNERQSAQTAFENFDQKADQLFNLLATVMKNLNEMSMGSTRNLV